MQRQRWTQCIFEDADVEEGRRVDVCLGVGPVDVCGVGVVSARARLVVGEVELGSLTVCDLDADVGGRGLALGSAEPSRRHDGQLFERMELGGRFVGRM